MGRRDPHQPDAADRVDQLVVQVQAFTDDDVVVQVQGSDKLLRCLVQPWSRLASVTREYASSGGPGGMAVVASPPSVWLTEATAGWRAAGKSQVARYAISRYPTTDRRSEKTPWPSALD